MQIEMASSLQLDGMDLAALQRETANKALAVDALVGAVERRDMIELVDSIEVFLIPP